MMIALECTGIGAKKFLQSQLTCDVNSLLPGVPQISACCNIQGRVIFTADIILENEEHFLLLIPQSMKTIAFTHLEKYAKFSKCSMAESRMINESNNDKSERILHGIPTIYPETSEQFIPQRLNLHLIPGAMSFKKGCYLGQEIIARMHFKGTLKHHMYLGELPKETVLNIGEAIQTPSGENTGFVIDYIDYHEKIALIFVNESENKMPHIHHYAIQQVTLPTYG